MIKNRSGPMLLLIFLLLPVGCSQPQGQKPIPFRPTGDIKHTMSLILDPAADLIWDSAGSIITVEGEEDLSPKTEEGWLAVQHSAMVVAETGNLLLMPGRTIESQDWQEIALGLVDAGLRVRQAAEDKDADALFDAGGHLYSICVACHSRYMVSEGRKDPVTR